MEHNQTFAGWTSFEIGHLTPQYDHNFVLYTNPNEHASGINCKIRVFDLVQSDIRNFLSQGGMCRVIVRGSMRAAPIAEQGWIPTTTRYLQVTWIMQDQGPEYLGEGIRETAAAAQQQQHAASNKFVKGGKRGSTEDGVIDLEAEDDEDDEEADDEDEEDSSLIEEELGTESDDLDYGSEQAKADEADTEEDFESMEEDEPISGEDLEALRKAARDPLEHVMNNIKKNTSDTSSSSSLKRGAQESFENGNNKKRRSSPSTPGSIPTPPTTQLQ
ncbi:hypothetical protein BDB00DRAFT_847900 [Zychaea mexicana]|uniref:uncharacterized protein n=1 Tax=Zychaea mexicana TaxID=64656 RepID=UPI0022FED03A|nr:uncharacterized protein BDB00DRAFT_847900 [Zychaea mexicana]KAI9488494.1 hypothetical protein BDB00DRAFT_847900 [Zychaea mexicana]